MSCGMCANGWILSPLDENHTCSPPSMRCECRGGVQGLASQLRSGNGYGNMDLAARIEQTFKGISPGLYKAGTQRLPCKCAEKKKAKEDQAKINSDDAPF